MTAAPLLTRGKLENILKNPPPRKSFEWGRVIYPHSPSRWARHLCGIDLDPWQCRLMDNRGDDLLINCSRQSGKSTVAGLLATHKAVFNAGSLSVILAPANRQSAETLRVAKRAYRTAVPDGRLLRDNVYDLEFSNNSRVVTVPATEGTIRGIPGVKLLILDEASRIPDEVYFAALPFIAASKGQRIAMSTPNGLRGWWSRAWHGEDGEPWSKVEVPATECPRLSKEKLEGYRLSMNERRFMQEFMCQFNALEGAWLDSQAVDHAAQIRDDYPSWEDEID